MIWVMVAGLAGFLIGALAVFLYYYRKTTKALAQAELLKEKLLITEERLSRESLTRESLEKEFRLAASDTLQKTTEQFLTAAIKDLRQVKTETDLSVEQKKNDIESFVGDMKLRLDESQKLLREFEAERHQMYGKLEHSLAQVLNAENLIRLETGALKKALTSSTGIRGKWGERVLEEILEQNNLVRGIHFDTQMTMTGSSADSDSSDMRPDFIIRLPGDKKLVVDSKEVTGEYVLAQETDDPEIQKEHYLKLVANIRTNFAKLSKKEYQSQLDADVPFVVMFIPSEAAIRAAFATDPGIFQEATTKKVILASPMTIVPLIYLIANSWQKQKLADNARELGVAVEELGNRLYNFIAHLQSIRVGIIKTSDSWDKAMGSWKSKLAPQIERARALGGRLKDTEPLESLDYESLPQSENN